MEGRPNCPLVRSNHSRFLLGKVKVIIGERASCSIREPQKLDRFHSNQKHRLSLANTETTTVWAFGISLEAELFEISDKRRNMF